LLAPKHIAVLLAGFSLAAQGAESAPKKPVQAAKPTQPDIQFLVYLGTVDGDDENWTDALSDALIDARAAEPQGKVNAKVAAPEPVVERK
jgi:hypothetical protein